MLESLSRGEQHFYQNENFHPESHLMLKDKCTYIRLDQTKICIYDSCRSRRNHDGVKVGVQFIAVNFLGRNGPG